VPAPVKPRNWQEEEVPTLGCLSVVWVEVKWDWAGEEAVGGSC